MKVYENEYQITNVEILWQAFHWWTCKNNCWWWGLLQASNNPYMYVQFSFVFIHNFHYLTHFGEYTISYIIIYIFIHKINLTFIFRLPTLVFKNGSKKQSNCILTISKSFWQLVDDLIGHSLDINQPKHPIKSMWTNMAQTWQVLS